MNMRVAVWFCGVVSAVSLFAEGVCGVILEWMGKQKVLNHHNEVPFHVLERKWSWVKNADESDAALTLRKTRNVSGASDKSELKKNPDDEYLLGVAFGVAYYFCLEAMHIVFKKIPRDVTRF